MTNAQQPSFSEFDTNGDKQISEEEFAAHQRYANPGRKNANNQMNKNSNSGGSTSDSSNSGGRN